MGPGFKKGVRKKSRILPERVYHQLRDSQSFQQRGLAANEIQKDHPKIGKLDMDLAKFGAAYNAGKPAINGFQDQNGAAPKVRFL